MGNQVLIVDDSPMARVFIARCLEAATGKEWEIQEAGDGEQALQKVKDGETFHLIITDLNMPNMNGKEFIENLRKLPGEVSRVPVAVITSANNDAKSAELKAAGATGVLSKPLTPMQMKGFLDEHFQAVI